MPGPGEKGRPELVAPAGSADAARAALAHGADAVYAGLRRFSARADAENLTLEELDDLVGSAKLLEPRRRVFVALNTLVLGSELGDLVDVVSAVAEIGPDALVVQDLGVARLARRHFPSLALHASTQMAAHSRSGVEALARTGFARVILARELTLDEVRECAAVPGVEVEVFVHGSLCYSYSGLCLFSSHALGLSGNRGRCAQPCRVAFLAGGSGDGPHAPARFPFTMKDLALAEEVGRLRDAGVDALKIEGRKRSAVYVAAVTDFYRRILDGRLPPAERARAEEDLKTVFSRPWTDLYARGRGPRAVSGPDAMGHRGARIGEVESVVVRGGDARAFLRFRTSRRLEIHDGLQVEPPGLERPFGFPVERMRVPVSSRRRKAKDVFEAPAGSMVEVELPEEFPAVPPGTAVYCASSQEVKQRFRPPGPAPGRPRARRPADFTVELRRDGVAVTARTELRADETPVEARSEHAARLGPAKARGKTAAAARAAFAKLGGTPFEIGSFEFRDPDRLFAPISTLNAARRKVADALEAALASASAARCERVRADVAPPAPAPAPAPGGFRWFLKTDRLAHVEAFEAGDWRVVEEVTVDISRDAFDDLSGGLERLAGTVGRERVRLALPVVTRAWEEADLRERIGRLREAGWARWEISNVSGWTVLGLDPAAGEGEVDLATHWPLYVTNRQAALALVESGAARFALSPEDGLANWRTLLAEFGPRAVVIVHQDTPLFISETCVPGAREGKGLRLVSSFGDRVVVIEAGARTVVVHESPFCLSERLGDLADAGAVSLRCDFVWRDYAPMDARDRWRAVRSGAAVPGARAANFDRGLA